MFALGISYLTGYATATSVGRREESEWPPHPGRIFMAMVAALYETKPLPSDAPALADWTQEHEMLEWLEALNPPSLKVSDADKRLPVTCYVPVNDKPSFPANRQPRSFPKVRPHDPEIFLLWPDASPTTAQRESINRLCRKVIRVGHSSSLVQMWVIPQGHEPQPDLVPLAPSEYSDGATQLRVTSAGCLRYLQQQFRGEEIDRFFDLSAKIETAKGKARKAAEAEFEQTLGEKWTRSVQAPMRLHPILSVTRAYVRPAVASPEPTASTCFDPKLLVLAQNEGPSLGLEATSQLLDALRGAILKNCPDATEWITGHRPDGLPSEHPHVALMPLSFVGSEHADGHLLGLAVAFPRTVSARERARALGRFLYSSTGDPSEITLTLGRLGVWTLQQEQRPAPPRALRVETWTQASHTWASVTPVVLNRHPKTDPEEDRVAWFNEIALTVAASCEHIGLPKPVEIDIDKTSWHRGAPRAKPGMGGFPLLPGKPGAPARQQVHVWLRFAQPIEGPLLIGAGRYRGYGLCKPWQKATS